MIEFGGGERSAGVLGVVAAAVAALLPKLTCPVCWPAYTALLSALGVGFVDYTPYLLPMTAGFVAVSLAALSITARVKRTYVPLLVGVAAAAVLLLGKFLLESEIMTYAGVGLLVVAPFLPARRRAAAACVRCVPMPGKEIA